MFFDLHVHSTVSQCSRLTAQEILFHAAERGLDGVCITDHHSMAVDQEIREGIQENGLCVIFGMEYSTSEGDFLIFGPFDGIPKGLAARTLLRYVEICGGAAIAAHPFRSKRPVSEHLIREGVCRIVEKVNGRNHFRENALADECIRKHGCIPCGGSDAHSLEELGRCRTFFPTPIRNRAELIGALRQGQCEAVALPETLIPHLPAWEQFCPPPGHSHRQYAAHCRSYKGHL